MRTQVRIRKLFWVGLSLLLLVAPLPPVQGQDVESSDTSGDVTVEADAVDAPLSEDLVAAPTGDMPYMTFLPVVGGSETNNAGTDEVVAAFNHPWVAEPCTNVVVGLFPQRGLWDDMPGGVINVEAGL